MHVRYLDVTWEIFMRLLLWEDIENVFFIVIDGKGCLRGLGRVVVFSLLRGTIKAFLSLNEMSITPIIQEPKGLQIIRNWFRKLG